MFVWNMIVHDHHKIIKQKFVEQTVKLHLKEGNKLSLTLDEWTSKKNRRYLNINLHESGIFGSSPATKAL